MANQETGGTNPQCTTSEQPEETDGLAEFYKSLSTDYNVMPLFERQYSDFMSIRKYSLMTNEKLRSGYHQRVMNEQRPTGPKMMPNMNDYHFHNCRIKFMPSQSLANFPPPRYHLAPGPGVDKYGQRPIPDDMLLKKPTTKSAVKQKTKILKKEQREPKKS